MFSHRTSANDSALRIMNVITVFVIIVPIVSYVKLAGIGSIYLIFDSMKDVSMNIFNFIGM